MICQREFWQDEFDSPLLSRNNHFMSLANSAELCMRAKGWLDILGAHDIAVNHMDLYIKPVDERHSRIFRMDAERTWIPKDDASVQRRTILRQQLHSDNLKLAVHEIGAYNQGLGYIGALASMVLNQEDAVRLLLALHRSERHSAGYFNADSAFWGDAKVFMELLCSRYPAVADNMTSCGVMPEMFASKWFVALCVHVLPFQELFDYWEAYFEQGSEFLFKFGLAFVSEFENELMSAKTTADMQTIFRVEDSHQSWKFPEVAMRKGLGVWRQIIERALATDLSDVPLMQMRQDSRAAVALYNAAVHERDRSMRDAESDDGICFSDEEHVDS